MYEDCLLWMRTRYEYKTLHITDFSDDVLKASMNPFAAVVWVAKETQIGVKEPDEDAPFRENS